MIFQTLSPNDFPDLARIHLATFDGFFLTSLGLRFLKTYYKTSLSDSHTIAVCAKDEYGEIKGFATGTIHSAGYHLRLFRKNPFGFLFSVFRSAVVRPGVFIRLFKNLDKSTHQNDDRNYAELLSIAVLPNAKRSGIGKGLIDAFEEEVKKRGGTKIALTTDFENNDKVIAFYKKADYRIFYEFKTYPSRRMYKMIKDL